MKEVEAPSFPDSQRTEDIENGPGGNELRYQSPGCPVFGTQPETLRIYPVKDPKEASKTSTAMYRLPIGMSPKFYVEGDELEHDLGHYASVGTILPLRSNPWSLYSSHV